jgi:hypothetical protein
MKSMLALPLIVAFAFFAFHSEVRVEDGVVMGNSLPRFGTACGDVAVRGTPSMEFDPLYVLADGSRVRLREQSHGADRSWVMIAPAEWIPIGALCEVKR